mmetsp:Transcript_50169/g.115794  ORF Transcript_50169/g.115794 Transcript_50169/m.115794 type:complete len:1111 (-) Transcript_50169:342-3674(-)
MSVGFVYTRDEMLEIYKRGDWRKSEFADCFTHVANVTTPEVLIPLAMIPIANEEVELRAAPIATAVQLGGRAGGRGFQDRDGRGRGRGRGGMQMRDNAWGAPRNSNETPADGQEQRRWEQRNEHADSAAEARAEARRWGPADARLDRGPRDAGGAEGGGMGGDAGGGMDGSAGGGEGTGTTCAAGAASAPRDFNGVAAADAVGEVDGGGLPSIASLGVELPRTEDLLPTRAPPQPPSTPKDWYYRDLESKIRGPFAEAQISEWYNLGYLPPDLQMRSGDEPAELYTRLSELTSRAGGEPPFVTANNAQQQYAVELEQYQQQQKREQQRQEEQQQQEEQPNLLQQCLQEVLSEPQQAYSMKVGNTEMQEHRAAEERRRQDEERARIEAAQREEAAREQAAREQAACEQAVREQAAREATQREMQRAAEEEGRRQAELHRKMLEDARRQAEEEAEELRRRALEDARKQAESEARRAREEIQQRLQVEAEQLARQQAEAQEQARRQAHELAMQQAALEEAKRRQAESEEVTRRKAEQLARQQAALDEHQRQLSILPPAGAANAGSALLSLLQGSDGGSGGGSLAGLAGWGGGQGLSGAPQPPPQSLASSQLEQFWSQPGAHVGDAQAALAQAAFPQPSALPQPAPQGAAELTGWGRGRGRGRGVSSTPLGTARRGVSDADALLGGAEPSRGLGGISLTDSLGAAEGSAFDGAFDDSDAFDGEMRKGRGKRAGAAKVGGKEDGRPLTQLEDAARADDVPWGVDGAAPSSQSAQPAWGWGAPQVQTGGGNVRALSLQEIQQQEERQRKLREANAAVEREAMQARAAKVAPGSVWGNAAALVQTKTPPRSLTPPAPLATAPPRPTLPTAPKPAAPVEEEDDGLLWDYGSAAATRPSATTTAPAPQPAAANGSTPFPALAGTVSSAPSPAPAAVAAAAAAAAAPASKGKKKKSKCGSEAAPVGNGGSAEGDAVLALESGQMPESMSRWCQEQMLALIGNDDTTLSHFLFSLPNDSEVESYLSMYLGSSPAVTSFAREFLLQKRAALGMGASREWQTAKPRGKAAPAPAPQGGVDDGEGAGRGKRKGKKKAAVDPSLLGFSVESSRIMQGEIQFVEGM